MRFVGISEFSAAVLAAVSIIVNGAEKDPAVVLSIVNDFNFQIALIKLKNISRDYPRFTSLWFLVGTI